MTFHLLYFVASDSNLFTMEKFLLNSHVSLQWMIAHNHGTGNSINVAICEKINKFWLKLFIIINTYSRLVDRKGIFHFPSVRRIGNIYTTSVHSSRMRLAHLLTVSQNALCNGGVCIPACTGRGCVSVLGRCLPKGVSAQGVCVCPGVCGRHPPGPEADTPPPTPLWTEWQTGVKSLPCRNLVAGGNK